MMSSCYGEADRSGDSASGFENMESGLRLSSFVCVGGVVTRRDARTNRARILEVAEDVFGRGGESASTEEVARLAGVGIATVFRHFPTKAALLEAVLLERFGRLREYA